MRVSNTVMHQLDAADSMSFINNLNGGGLTMREAINTESFIKRVPKGRLINVVITCYFEGGRIEIRVPGRLLSVFWAITPELTNINEAEEKKCRLTHIPSGLAAGAGTHRKIIMAWNRMPASMKRNVVHERDKDAFAKNFPEFVKYVKENLPFIY